MSSDQQVIFASVAAVIVALINGIFAIIIELIKIRAEREKARLTKGQEILVPEEYKFRGRSPKPNWRRIVIRVFVFTAVGGLIGYISGSRIASTFPPPTPTPTQLVSVMFSTATTPTTETPTPAPTLTVTPTPILCPNVQISSSLELHLATGVGQRKDSNEKGEIVLTPDDIAGLSNLSGQAILTNANGCTCNWQGRMGVDNSWESINSRAGDCSFSIELPDQAMTIHLLLTIGNRQSKLFTIKVSDQ